MGGEGGRLASCNESVSSLALLWGCPLQAHLALGDAPRAAQHHCRSRGAARRCARHGQRMHRQAAGLVGRRRQHQHQHQVLRRRLGQRRRHKRGLYRRRHQLLQRCRLGRAAGLRFGEGCAQGCPCNCCARGGGPDWYSPKPVHWGYPRFDTSQERRTNRRPRNPAAPSPPASPPASRNTERRRRPAQRA